MPYQFFHFAFKFSRFLVLYNSLSCQCGVYRSCTPLMDQNSKYSNNSNLTVGGVGGGLGEAASRGLINGTCFWVSFPFLRVSSFISWSSVLKAVNCFSLSSLLLCNSTIYNVLVIIEWNDHTLSSLFLILSWSDASFFLSSSIWLFFK